MNKITKALFLALMPFLPAYAAEKAEFKEYLQQSIFPLQDQARFYNRKVEFSDGLCKEKDSFAIYNLKENHGRLEYDCIGKYNASCGQKCIGGGIFIGAYTPEIACEGELFSEGKGYGDSFVVEKEVCKDEKGRVIWERNRDDKYGFDHLGRLFFFHNNSSTTSFRNRKIQRKIVYTPNEYMLYDNDAPQDYFHVKYDRDAQGNIIRETHFNKDDFPYSIFEAEYQNGRCVKITKIDGYKGTKTVYEFQ